MFCLRWPYFALMKRAYYGYFLQDALIAKDGLGGGAWHNFRVLV